jgi:hypothetical protein
MKVREDAELLGGGGCTGGGRPPGRSPDAGPFGRPYGRPLRLGGSIAAAVTLAGYEPIIVADKQE